MIYDLWNRVVCLSIIPYGGIRSTTSNRVMIPISKRGSSDLRKSMFQVISCLCQHQKEDDPIYQFVARKKAEGKPYYVCMIAGCNKFLRIYYARVNEYLNNLELQA